jgi:chromosome segregation ATPase
VGTLRRRLGVGVAQSLTGQGRVRRDQVLRNRTIGVTWAGTLLTMSQPSDLEARVTALESRVEELTGRVHRSERDAAAARVLAGGADRDVEQIRGEIRDFKQATTASFNAMREDVNDLRSQMNTGFAEIRNGVARGFAEVDRGFIEIRGRLDATAAGIEQIATMLGRGERRPDGPA